MKLIVKTIPIVPLTNEISVGRELRKLRTERGLSIRALAQISGLNVNTLSLIENSKTSPSVSTLQQIAAALKTPITVFFEVLTHPKSLVFQKAYERQAAAFANGTLADLAVGFSQSSFEPFEVTLEPQAESGATPIVHTGLEFVYCLEGQIDYEVDGNSFTLKPGDSLLFEAHLPHRWRNAGSISSRSLLLLCSTDESDQPDIRHFK
jgi:transcriptional regulator with XRE-family HTH domain